MKIKTKSSEIIPETPHKNVGKKFLIQLDCGAFIMECVRWNDELREFNCPEGFISMDWMEYVDQKSVGRIKAI